MKRPFLNIHSLNFAYQADAILEGVSFDASEGEITMLVGASGSGKSTMLRLINRLTEPPAGAIWLNGEDVTTLNPLALRRRVGLVFQRPYLFTGTVADNIRYGPRLVGNELSDETVSGLLTAVLLSPELAKTAVETLSGGQIQRVAIARVLANEPELILLDEPTTALDPRAAKQVEETISNLCQNRGLTVIWVTHDVAQVRRVADRIVFLQKGKVMAQGNLTEMFELKHDAFHTFVNGLVQP
ncbi:MAG: phosphate ABC transporter ATP-binding protein [Chloroflexota bacterium]